MKTLLVVLVAAIAPMFAQAQTPPPAAGNIDAAKAMVVQNVDKRVESLNKMKGCVQGATSHDAIKACREAHRTEMKSLEDANIDARIQQLQQKKAAKAK